MNRDYFNDLLAFVAVARDQSFTKAAAKLGVSQSLLSHKVRDLETRLGVRLLTRTTRSVMPTEAGERLMATVAPRLQEIEDEVAAVVEMGDRIVGTVRITAIDHVIEQVIWPRLVPVLAQHSGVRVEISSDYRMVDIVQERFDIGVRWGDQVAKDMVAVRIGPDMRMSVVGSPAYFEAHGRPTSPQDLLNHNCITLRLASSGGIYAWEMQHDGRPVQVRVTGQSTFNGVYQMVSAALTGSGLALVPEDLVLPLVEQGRLVSVLANHCTVFPGLHAYYPSRRQSSRVLALVIDALRQR